MGKHEDYGSPYMPSTVIVELALFPGMDYIYPIGGDKLRLEKSPKRRNKHRLTNKFSRPKSRAVYFDSTGTLHRNARGYLSVARDLEVGELWKKPR